MSKPHIKYIIVILKDAFIVSPVCDVVQDLVGREETAGAVDASSVDHGGQSGLAEQSIIVDGAIQLVAAVAALPDFFLNSKPDRVL